MSDPIFSARFTPNSSTPVDADTFDVQASIYDGTGQFSGLDIQVGDIVFLDCFPSISNPNSICKFVIDSIITPHAFNPTVRMSFNDTGVVVDPGEVAGNPGFICRSSGMNPVAFHAAPTLHTFPDYVVQYARNIETIGIIEPNLGGGGGATNQKIMIVGAAVAAGKPVSKRPDGKVIQADSDAVNARNVVGISVGSAAADGDPITIQLFGANMAGVLTGMGFVPGSDIFLNQDSSGYTDNPDVALTGADDDLIKVGVADCAANTFSASAVDLIILPQVIARI